MPTLKHCLLKTQKRLSDDRGLIAAVDRYKQAGLSVEEASERAVTERLGLIQRAETAIARAVSDAYAMSREDDGAAVQPAAPADFGAAFKDALADQFGADAAAASGAGKPTKKPRTRSDKPKTPKSPAPGKTAGEAAASAGQHVSSAALEAGKALVAIFNKRPGTLGSGPVIDEESYRQARPHFIAVARELGAAARDVGELMRAIVRFLVSLGLNREGVAGMEPYAVRFGTELHAGLINLGEDNAQPSSERLEQDRRDGDAAQSERGAPDGDDAGEDGRDLGGAGRSLAQEREQLGGDRGVPGADDPAGGESDDQRVHREDGSLGSEAGDPGRGDGRGSGGDRSAGLPVDEQRADETLATAEAAATAVADRARAQAAANAAPPPVILGDLDNIRAALPALLPEQQEDVQKAERRFAEHHGMMFTNGTGTGKTWTGIGIVKRFAAQGKNSVLVVAPSQDIVEEWIKVGKAVGLPIARLASTSENGEHGIVATTYANFGANPSLAERDWDLVVNDESHKLMQAADGAATSAASMLRAITNHPHHLGDRARTVLREDYAKLKELVEAAQSAARSDDERHWPYARKKAADADALRKDLDERTAALVKKFAEQPRSKVVFLSATPFAYHFTLDYGNGYLFDYSENKDASQEGVEALAYNRGDHRDQFFMQHFGYRMRYNKLTTPRRGVNVELLEREFHEKLRRDGALSGRKLTVDADYDRKFILADSGVGRRIDEALDYLFSAKGEGGKQKYPDLYRLTFKKFDYLSRMRLLEAIKAEEAVGHIRQHHALGRKVVVFHDYNSGGGFSPFNYDAILAGQQGSADLDTGALDADDAADAVSTTREESAAVADMLNDPETNRKLREQVAALKAERPDILDIDFSHLPSPIVTLTRAFPGALTYNGTVKIADRRAARGLFNEDGNDSNLIIVQSAAGEAGISLHDTTGQHQRVLINLGLPVRPVSAIQQEGRIYRVGQRSDAVMRYMTTGTGWETSAFASKVAARSGTAENLGMGNEARALRQSFIDAYNDADINPASADDGKGGKALDAAGNAALSPFDRAKTFYYAQQKNSARRGAREGKDYYATPEPIGLKMVELAGLRPLDRVLEPSAGHGAIARFFPENNQRTVMELSPSLAPRAAMAAPGAKLIQGDFIELPIVNKYDAVVMNPPYGSGGADAMRHVAKAAKHLRNGGRIVALIPRGGRADTAFEKFRDSEDAQGLHLVREVILPSVTFSNAGTGVNTRIVVLEKQTDDQDAAKLPTFSRADYSGAQTVEELFDRIESLSAPERTKPSQEDGETLLRGDDINLAGADFTVLDEAALQIKPKARLGKDEFARAAGLAKKFGGVFDKLSNAFEFTDAKNRDQWLEAFDRGDEPPSKKDAEREAQKAEAERIARALQSAGASVEAILEAAALPEATHVTGSGKTLHGVIVQLPRKLVKDRIDPYTFPKNGGMFVRQQHAAKLAEVLIEQAAASGAAPSAPTSWRSGEDAEGAPVSLADAQAHVAAVMADWKRKPDVTVVATADDLPEAVQAEAKNQGVEGAKGAFHHGKLYVVAGSHTSLADVEATLFHEVWGHYGLATRLGAQITPMLAAVFDQIGGLDAFRQFARKHGFETAKTEMAFAKARGIDPRFTPEMRKRLLVEELVASVAEGGYPGLKQWVQEFIGKLRAFLRSHGFLRTAAFNDADLMALVASARESAIYGGGTAGASAAPTLWRGAWHGAGKHFDRFSTDHIGTGEGHQVYGWGLYFASQREVAEYYRDTVAGNGSMLVTYGGKTYSMGRVPERTALTEALLADGALPEVAHAAPILLRKHGGNPLRAGSDYSLDDPVASRAQMRRFMDEMMPGKARGHIYEVELPDNDHLLVQWDAPLADQPKVVRAAFARLGVPERQVFIRRHDGRMIGPYADKAAARRTMRDRNLDGQIIDKPTGLTGGQAYAHLAVDLSRRAGFKGGVSQREASMALLAEGVRGVRYLDAQSRALGGAAESFNFVVFDANDVEIRALHSAAYGKTYREGTGTTLAQAQAAVARVFEGAENAPRVVIVDTPAKLDADTRRRLGRTDAGTEGAFDPASGTVYLFTDALASPERAAWVALHEGVGHYGILGVLGDGVADAVTRAYGNPTLAALANALADERHLPRTTAMLEALAELSAARETGRYGEIFKRYGVSYPASMKAGITAALVRLIQAIKRALTGRGLKGLSDADVVNLLDAGREFVNGGPDGGPRGGLPAYASNDAQPGFFSALSREVRNAKMGAAPAAGWKDWIKGMVSKGLIKQDEVEWTGLADWLELQGKKVSKEAVLEFLAGNGVQVEEVMLGGKPWVVNDESGAQERFATEEEAEDAAERWRDEAVEQAGEDYYTHRVVFNEENDDWDVLSGDGNYVNGGFSRESEAQSIADSLTDQAIDAIRDGIEARLERDDAGGAKYGEYTLPGGENYREVLLTLPEIPRNDRPTPLDALPAGYDTVLDNRKPVGQQWGVTPPGQRHAQPWAGLHASPEAARAAALEQLNEQAMDEWLRARPGFRSGHWDQPNILAHIRLNDRTDANGNKVLFVEEIQSDWGQAGKKRGFKRELPIGRKPSEVRGEQISVREFLDRGGDEDAQDWIDYQNELRRDVGDPPLTDSDPVQVIYEDGKLTRLTSKIRGTPEAWAESIAQEWERIDRHERDRHEEGNRDRVPAAPFVGKTDAWVALALKRVILMAVEGGYDRVAFINGQQSAERYDLSQQVRTIEWIGDSSGWKAVTITPTRGNDVEFRVKPDGTTTGFGYDETGNGFGGKKLDEVVGKDVADKIMADSDGSLSGNGLKVGGEGMVAFYDKIVPGVLKDVLKKVGGGKIEEVSFSHDPNPELDRWEPEDGAGDGSRVAVEEHRQPGFTITDAMREKVAQGLPLFSLRADQTKTAAFKRWFGESKVVDENGEPLVVYHGTGGDFAEFDLGKAAASPASEATGVQGFYFSPSPKVAGDYAFGKDGANVVPVYLSLANPLNVKYAELIGGTFDQKSLAAAGYDGLVVDRGGKPWAYVAFHPTQIKSATGNNGDYDPANPSILRSESASPAQRREAARTAANWTPIFEKLAQAFKGKETFGALDKTVHSQLHKASKNKNYKRVFDGVMAFMADASRAALRPADKAPTILPRMDVLEGLKPALTKLAGALRGGSKTDLDIDAAYQAVLAGTLDGEHGRIWKDADEAGLTADQWAVYQEFRDAIDASLDEMAASEAFRLSRTATLAGQRPLDGLKQAVINDPEGARDLLTERLKELLFAAREGTRDALGELVAALPPSIKVYLKTPKDAASVVAALDGKELTTEAERALAALNAALAAEAALVDIHDRVGQIFDRAARLKKDGYAPLMRFGQYTLDVVQTNPSLTGEDAQERLFFGMFESAAERDRVAAAMREKYAGMDSVSIEAGTKNEEEWKQYQGVNPESVMLFADLVGIDSDAVMQEWYRKAVSNRSTLKRLVHRKKVPGYSLDGSRVLASFITSNGRRASSLYHSADIDESIRAFPKAQGAEQGEAQKLADYVREPQEEAATPRALMVFHFLGGSISNFFLNLTQPAMVGIPFLAQRVGARKATSFMGRGYKGVNHPESLPDDVRAALERAEDEGEVGAQEIAHLWSETSRPLAASMGRFGRNAERGTQAFMALWMSPFAISEHINRRATFAAAFLAAQEAGDADPYAYAVQAIRETMFIYNKANRPNWGRGTLGALAFTFKMFTISYVELLVRMLRNGKDGKKAALLMLGFLFLASGLGGLPGADDADDLIDTVAQMMGYNFSAKHERRKFLEEAAGREVAEFVMHGFSTLLPGDAGSRMSLGNIAPGSALFKPSEDNRMGQLAELIGPVGGLSQAYIKAADAFTQGNAARGLAEMLPKAMRDVYQGSKMLIDGEHTDPAGRKVADVSVVGAISKIAGFNPTEVASGGRVRSELRDLASFARRRESLIAERWARGINEGRPDLVTEAKEMESDWNERNPDTPIKVKRSQAARRAEEMRKTAAARFIKSVPKEMRGMAREELGEDEQ